jgi:hypothetical protein
MVSLEKGQEWKKKMNRKSTGGGGGWSFEWRDDAGPIMPN